MLFNIVFSSILNSP